jgi:hypothetical protein
MAFLTIFIRFFDSKILDVYGILNSYFRNLNKLWKLVFKLFRRQF